MVKIMNSEHAGPTQHKFSVRLEFVEFGDQWHLLHVLEGITIQLMQGCVVLLKDALGVYLIFNDTDVDNMQQNSLYMNEKPQLNINQTIPLALPICSFLILLSISIAFSWANLNGPLYITISFFILLIILPNFGSSIFAQLQSCSNVLQQLFQLWKEITCSFKSEENSFQYEAITELNASTYKLQLKLFL